MTTVADKDVPERVEIMRKEVQMLVRTFTVLGFPIFLSVMVGEDYVVHGAHGTIDQLAALQLNAAEYLVQKMKQEVGGACDGDCGACQEAEKEEEKETLQ